MKICLVSNYRKNGYGESTRPYYLSLFLKKQGHEIIHLCKHEGVEEGITYIKVDTEYREPSLPKRVIDFLSLNLKLRLFNPDIIYVHQLNNARWATATKVLPKSVLVLDAHTSMYFEHKTFGLNTTAELEKIKGIEGAVYAKADYVICASKETKEILHEVFGIKNEKLFAVGNATNMVPVTEAEKNAKQAITNNSFTCLSTIPFDGFKSNEMALLYLFEIAAEVYKINSKIVFKVVGGGDKPKPPTPNVVYTGYVDDLRKEILQSNICLMTFPEKAVCGGARNKFCDFIALGKVVVTSPEGLRGMEILHDSKNCVVAQDKESFSQKILELAGNAAEVNRIEAEVEKIKDYYSWEKRASEVNETFKRILNG